MKKRFPIKIARMIKSRTPILSKLESQIMATRNVTVMERKFKIKSLILEDALTIFSWLIIKLPYSNFLS
jgi:hypothetical protein